MSKVPTTAQGRLDAVRTAIHEVLTLGQTTAFSGQSMTRANLEQLQQLEQRYANEVITEARTGRSRLIYVVPE